MTRATPAIPLFGDAYLADTRHLSLEEHGAYLQLMMIAWRVDGCELPDDDARLARMLGVTAKKWSKLKPVVMAFWALENGTWKQKRLSKERRWVAEKSEQNRAAVNARWQSKPLKTNDVGDTNVIPKAYGNDTPPPPPSKKEEVMPAKAGAYAFSGQTIRLSSRHLNDWRKTFHTVPDVEAELTPLDEWWQTQPSAKRENWFLATKGMLNKKHQTNVAAAKTASASGGWDGMP